jgi:hypothetical protein
MAEAKKTLNGVGHTSISQQPDLVELEQLDSLARVMGGVAGYTRAHTHTHTHTHTAASWEV